MESFATPSACQFVVAKVANASYLTLMYSIVVHCAHQQNGLFQYQNLMHSVQ